MIFITKNWTSMNIKVLSSWNWTALSFERRNCNVVSTFVIHRRDKHMAHNTVSTQLSAWIGLIYQTHHHIIHNSLSLQYLPRDCSRNFPMNPYRNVDELLVKCLAHLTEQQQYLTIWMRIIIKTSCTFISGANLSLNQPSQDQSL
jgi:hypothetical protein